MTFRNYENSVRPASKRNTFLTVKKSWKRILRRRERRSQKEITEEDLCSIVCGDSACGSGEEVNEMSTPQVNELAF
jgi:hypothetical protein